MPELTLEAIGRLFDVRIEKALKPLQDDISEMKQTSAKTAHDVFGMRNEFELMKGHVSTLAEAFYEREEVRAELKQQRDEIRQLRSDLNLANRVAILELKVP